MLLQRLVELRERNGRGPAMYQPTRVAWKVVLDADGGLVQFVPPTGKGEKGDRGAEVLAPTLVRASKIKPKLLCDNGEYVLGVARDGATDVEKVRERHQQFVDLTAACARSTGERTVRAVEVFLAAWDRSARKVPSGFDAESVVTFEVDGVRPIDLPSVQRFWASHTRGSDVGTPDALTCLVCGERKTPEKRHPKKIKGIPNGQESGTSMISANESAFLSYGLEASLVSPTCRECAEAFADALNGLLANEGSRVKVGSIVCVYWTRRAIPFDPFTMLTQPDEHVRDLLKSPMRGGDVSDLVEANDFYMVSLSASGGRVVVRDYFESSVEGVRGNLARWFDLLSPFAGDAPLGLRALARSLVHEDIDDLPPSVVPAIAQTALRGAPAPEALFQILARRNRVEGGPTRPRAALARVALVKNPKYGYQEDRFMALETENTDPAYVCGRLFAEIANAQRAALGETSVTLVDRYYGTASSAPAIVFGPLLRDTQRAYLPKLPHGTRVAIEQRIQEIASKLPAQLPATLDLKSQAVFSLGFHHQRAANFARAKERIEARKAGQKDLGDESIV